MGLMFVLLRSSENADAFGKCAMRSAVLKVVMKGHQGRYGTTLTNEFKLQDTGSVFTLVSNFTWLNARSGI